MFNMDQAAQFLSSWQRLQPTVEAAGQLAEWKSFFSNWQSLVPAVTASEKKPVLDCEKLDSFAQAFFRTYEEHRRSGATVNVWRVAGLNHDELRNSQVLTWILDKFGEHGQGSAVLERLVELTDKRPEGVTAQKVRDNNYWTRTESLPLGDVESRVDIEIESAAFLIFIEVKIRARETGDQLKRYVDLATKKAAGRPWIIVFLTTDGRPPDNAELRDKVIPLKWNQIANILDAHAVSELGNSFSGRIFRQFANHIRQLA